MNQELKQIGLGLGGVILARAISGLIPASKNPALIKIAFAGASGFGAYKVDNADVKALLVGASIGMGADAIKVFAEKSEALQQKKATGGTLNNMISSAVGLGSPADMEEEFGLNGMVQGNDGVWYEVDETGLQGTYIDENGNVFENGLNATYVDEYGNVVEDGLGATYVDEYGNVVEDGLGATYVDEYGNVVEDGLGATYVDEYGNVVEDGLGATLEDVYGL